MLRSIGFVKAVLLLCGFVTASPTQLAHHKREAVSCVEIGNYFSLINTALFSVNYVRNSPHPCNLDLIPVFNARGLNGVYALEIICLYDSGVDLFGNQSLVSVNDDLIVSLIGLFDAAFNDVGPSRNLSCANIDTDILSRIGLPATTIQDIICDFTPCTLQPPVNATSVVPTSLVPSSTASRSIVSSPSTACHTTAAPSTSVPTSSSTGDVAYTYRRQ